MKRFFGLKKFFVVGSIALFGFLSAGVANAICPVCTFAIGFGVGLSRWLGIDDLISGTWIGGLIASMVYWLLGWLDKKNIKFIFRGTIVAVLFYALAIVPLYYLNIIGHSLNKFLGADKLLFGIAAGTLAFAFSVWLHIFLKKKNQDKSFFPFQKVVIPIFALIVVSLIFCLIIYVFH